MRQILFNKVDKQANDHRSEIDGGDTLTSGQIL